MNQIAAGEVVERPASVVKEVMENAVDARATRIVVELEQGGVELIRVTDDGVGIPPEELALAIAPHATSKIREAADLDRIGTMGFRGEALASIASVSRLSVRSRTAEDVGASEIGVEGDLLKPVKPASGAVGTCVSVRNLFFNTPARRKFLRTPQTEQGHCLDVVCALAIAHPGIAVRAVCDGRTVLDVPGGQTARARALAVLGEELSGQLLEVHADAFDDARGLTLSGLAGRPEIARATAKGQYLFLNGRTIRDRTVQHALREAYRGLIEPGRYPTAVLMIEMDPGAVDVNVHPAKAEVRFRDQSMVHGVILRSVREALRRADLTPSVQWGAPGGGEAGTPRREEFGTGLPSAAGGGHAGGGLDGFSGGGGGGGGGSGAEAAARLVEFLKRPASMPVHAAAIREAVRDGDGGVGGASAGGPGPFAAGASGSASGSGAGGAELLEPPRRERLLQVHKSFVVTQDQEGLLIVDQHALHERVMFEALLQRVRLAATGGDAGAGADGGSGAGATLESQRLLVPAVVKTSRGVVSRLEELKPLLTRIGVSVEALSPESVGVHAFPTFLFDRGVDPVEFLAGVFEKAEADNFDGWGGGGAGNAGGTAGEAVLHEVLDMMACKAAVKAGDYLSDAELADLLKMRDLVERSSNCPHGRPTSIRVTIRELEKRFGRV